MWRNNVMQSWKSKEISFFSRFTITILLSKRKDPATWALTACRFRNWLTGIIKPAPLFPTKTPSNQQTHQRKEKTTSAHISDALENGNRSAEIIPVVALRHRAHTIDRDHIICSLGAEAPDVDVLGAIDGEHVFLAGLGCEAGLGVVVVEGVEASFGKRLV